MERFTNFLRGRGFALALAACVLAAAVTGIWAVRTLRSRMEEDLSKEQTAPLTGAETDPGIEEKEEAETWQQETAEAAKEQQGVPESSASPSTPGPSAGSSSSSAGSGSVLEPSELQTSSSAASVLAPLVYTPPVTGRVLAGYSGDELVYSETLGDWRTHNGADFAAEEGEQVIAPAAGEVEQVTVDGNWGPVVAIRDEEGRLWRVCGVADPQVKEGDKVEVAQPLGQVGTVGCESSLEPHVHLEILDGDKYLDPVKILSK